VTGPQATDEWRALRIGFAVVAALLVAEVAGWLVYRSVHDAPTPLELTERCLRREKLLRTGPVGEHPIARGAGGGALATRVEDNGVVVSIAESEREADELAELYLRTGRKIELRLDRRGRVLYEWELLRRPSPTERQTMYDCWYE